MTDRDGYYEDEETASQFMIHDEDTTDVEQTNTNEISLTEDEAATKIQATWRGHSQRKKLREQGILTPKQSKTTHNYVITNANNQPIDKQPTILTKQLSSLQTAINDLSSQITEAEHKTNMAEKEASMRLDTIKKLRKLHENSLEDFNNVNATLTVRNQQVSSLKNTIKQLQQELQLRNSNYAQLQIKMEQKDEIIQTQKHEIAKLNAQLSKIFESNVDSNPQIKKMFAEFTELKEKYQIEKEARKNATNAWQKASETIKNYESKLNDENSNFLQNANKIKVENDSLKQKIAFQNEKESILKKQNDSIKQELKNLQNESMQLKIRLANIETEIRSANEMERLKQTQWTDSVVNQFKWREHMLMSKLNEKQRELTIANLARLELSKELKQCEIEIAEQNITNVAKQMSTKTKHHENDDIFNATKAISKRKHRELEEIDQQLMELKQNIKPVTQPLPPPMVMTQPPMLQLQQPMSQLPRIPNSLNNASANSGGLISDIKMNNNVPMNQYMSQNVGMPNVMNSNFQPMSFDSANFWSDFEPQPPNNQPPNNSKARGRSFREKSQQNQSPGRRLVESNKRINPKVYSRNITQSKHTKKLFNGLPAPPVEEKPRWR